MCYCFTGNGGDQQIIEGTLANDGVDSVQINVAQADAVITATLVWMDPPGTPVAPSLDPPDLMLVNDLDLRITKGVSTYQPWVMDPALPAVAATTGDNFRDNVEQVKVFGAQTGLYSVEVRHKGTLLNTQNQDYSLVISIKPPPPTGSGLLIDEDFSAGLPTGWTVDTLMGIDWTINTPVVGDPRLDNLTGGAGQFAIVDNGYIFQTVTSLQTLLLDLSSAEAAVLRFKSNYYYDTFESLNVDVSTDGGIGWINVWMFQGFNPFPTSYSLDISTAVAGQSSVKLRFRFDSEGFISGDYWQVDDVELEVFGGDPPVGDPPGQAADPNPANGVTGAGTSTTLSWSAGSLATSHDVYFGSSTPLDGSDLQGNQTGTSFDPGALAFASTYYWRIDAVNESGTTTGAVWSFSTAATPQFTHLLNLQGIGEPANRGRWNALVTITIADGNGLPVAGALTEGDWSNGATGATSCTTDASGVCSLSKQNLKGNVASVDFTVTNVTASGYNYDSGANEVPGSITVFKDDPNLLPNAVDDNFATPADTPLNDNVISNDDQGDPVTTVTAFDATSVNGFTVNMATTGDFSYIPGGGFEGLDSFAYTISDSDGDNSSATVHITVGNPPVSRSVTTAKFKDKGDQKVLVSWSAFQDADVIISRNGVVQATVANSPGDWQDNLGKKPSGNFVYEVCEAGPSVACTSDFVSY